MSDEQKGGQRRSTKKRPRWTDFSIYTDGLTGVVLQIQKAGGDFSPRWLFTHEKSKEPVPHGRIRPDYREDLDAWEPFKEYLEAVHRIVEKATQDLRVQAKKDRDDFLRRRDRSHWGATLSEVVSRPPKANGKKNGANNHQPETPEKPE